VITFSKEVGDLHFTSFFIVHLLKQSKMKLAVNKAMTNNKMDMGPRNQIATTHGKKSHVSFQPKATIALI